jgi:hypothetical protein
MFKKKIGPELESEPKIAANGYISRENPRALPNTLKDLCQNNESNKKKEPNDAIGLLIWRKAADGDTKDLLELIAEWCGNDVMNWKRQTKHHHYTTPLYVASLYGRKDCVTALLIVPNINVNLTDSQGYTPLHAAVNRGNFDIVKLLMDKPGIKPNISSSNDFTPLGLAVHTNNKKIVELLLSDHKVDPNIGTPIFFPILSKKSDSTILKMLVSHKNIDVNVNPNGKTPLYYAVKNKLPDMVECLLSHENIDVNCKNENEETPLYIAVDIINPDIVKSLLANKNIDVNIQTKLVTPFDHALAIFIFFYLWQGPLTQSVETFKRSYVRDIITILNLLRKKGAAVTENFKLLEFNDLQKYTQEHADDGFEALDYNVKEENDKMKDAAKFLFLEYCTDPGDVVDIDIVRYIYMAWSKESDFLNKDCNNKILELLDTREKRSGHRYKSSPVPVIPVTVIGGSKKLKKTKRRHNKKRKSVKRKPIKNSSPL